MTLEDGRDAMERYDPKRHGPWLDIPDIGLTPSQLLDNLYGFGETVIDQGQQFQRERKREGGASKTNWAAGHNPKPDSHPISS